MVEILQYTQNIRLKLPEFLTPNQFAWKPWFIRFVFESSDVQNVFWIHSGIVTFGNINLFLKLYLFLKKILYYNRSNCIIINIHGFIILCRHFNIPSTSKKCSHHNLFICINSICRWCCSLGLKKFNIWSS